jgi:BRCA1-associated protein
MRRSYVHRLLQNRSDGKLVELPSATTIVSSRLSSLALDPLSTRANGPTASHEKDMTALERMAREAAQLSAQLAEQKDEYEAEVRRLRRELAVADEKAREGGRMRDLLAEEEARRREIEERVAELSTAKTRAEAKTQIVCSSFLL